MSKSRRKDVKAVQLLSGVKTRLQFSLYRSFSLLSHEVVSRQHSVTVYKQPTADSFAPRVSATRCVGQLDKWQNEDESSRLCPGSHRPSRGCSPPALSSLVWIFSEKKKFASCEKLHQVCFEFAPILVFKMTFYVIWPGFLFQHIIRKQKHKPPKIEIPALFAHYSLDQPFTS